MKKKIFNHCLLELKFQIYLNFKYVRVFYINLSLLSLILIKSFKIFSYSIMKPHAILITPRSDNLSSSIAVLSHVFNNFKTENALLASAELIGIVRYIFNT